MASPPPRILLFVSTSCLLCLILTRAQQGTIPVGAVISATTKAPGSSWLSPSGRFAFGFYPVGANFSIGVWFVANSTVIWTADRDGPLHPLGTKLTLTEDGLQIPSPTGDRPICNISSSAVKLESASMLDSGDFVIVDVNKKVVWQTFDYPTDTLMGGQILHTGQCLVSSVSSTDHRSGRFQFVMHDDGNLDLRPVNTPETKAHSYWSTDSSGDGYTGVLVSNNGILTWIREPNATHSSTVYLYTLYFARMEPDGYLRMYSTNTTSTQQTRQWPSKRNTSCIVKGTCGPNSFCKANYTNNSTPVVSCLCFAGFVYADPTRSYMGCLRNFSLWQCFPTKENNITYSISRLTNVSWIDDPYNYTYVDTEKACSDSCFRDCNCYAAMYANQRCSKQKYPLLYPIWNVSVPTVAFLKVGSGDPLLLPQAKVVHRFPSDKTLVFSAIAVSVLVMSLAAGVFLLYIYRETSYQKQCRNMETGMAGGMAPRSFTYAKLVEATDGFKNPVGKGRFSTVYKGEVPLTKPAQKKASDASLRQQVSVASALNYPLRLLHLTSSSILKKKAKQDSPDKFQTDRGTEEVMHIAVKVLEKMDKEDEKRFRIEMRAAGRAHHRNIVRLLGFCLDGPNLILVYEDVTRGSLHGLISFPEKRPSWRERVHIALDVARGLHYLHVGCGAAIIHSDIKPENVLVDEDFTAKVADLGLAKLLQPWESKAYTRPRGTPFYKAPEWTKLASEPVTPKVDVYSFGVLLLELVTCRTFFQEKPVDGRHYLSEWAYKCLMESTLESLLPEGEQADDDELKTMVVVALFCVHKEPEKRLEMKDVVGILGGKMSIPSNLPPDPNVVRIGPDRPVQQDGQETG